MAGWPGTSPTVGSHRLRIPALLLMLRLEFQKARHEMGDNSDEKPWDLFNVAATPLMDIAEDILKDLPLVSFAVQSHSLEPAIFCLTTRRSYMPWRVSGLDRRSR